MQVWMRIMCLCRVGQLQAIQSRTAEPGSGQSWILPPAEDIEKELYRRANTLEEYTKYSSFNQRFSKIVESWRQNQVRSKARVITGQRTTMVFPQSLAGACCEERQLLS